MPLDLVSSWDYMMKNLEIKPECNYFPANFPEISLEASLVAITCSALYEHAEYAENM